MPTPGSCDNRPDPTTTRPDRERGWPTDHVALADEGVDVEEAEAGAGTECHGGLGTQTNYTGWVWPGAES